MLPLRRSLLAILLAVPSHAQERPSVSGLLTDSAGAPVSGASVSLVSPQGSVKGSVRSTSQGEFRIANVAVGTYLLVVESAGFASRRVAVRIEPGGVDGLKVSLQRGAAFSDEVTVTASPGRAQEVEDTPQRVNVIDGEEIGLRAKAVAAQVANGEVGIHLQRTSPTIGGIFIRGLTGTKVNVYVDGVRYTTSAQRGGISTFLNMIEPEALSSVEVLRGPSSAEYGSDALGGSVQFLTHTPSLSNDGGRVSGSWTANFGSTDASYGSGLNAAYAGARFGLSGTVAGRRINTLRPGGGLDSHNAATRFLGLPSSVLIGERLPDTAFTQYGGHLKANWAVSSSSQVVASYLRTQQDGGKRYDQLVGGDGNLVAELKNLMVDHAFARWEKTQAALFDRLAISYSFSAQREERVNQGGNGNPRATINHEPERTSAHGFQVNVQRSLGRHGLGVGADAYLESITAPSFGVNPATSAVSPRRGRVPDGARYRNGGAFVQDVFEAIPGKLKLTGAMRFGIASYEAKAADVRLASGKPLWPDDTYDTSALTFRLGALWDATRRVSLAANVSRGFRAPDITDLGTFGLTGSGYEVSNREVEGLGGLVGSTADAQSVSTGRPVGTLDPETSLNYELTLRYRDSRLRTALTAFLINIEANIAKQALILPGGAVGVSLAGEPIIRQLDSGVVFVAVSSSPVLVRVNFDEARLYGFEHNLDWQASSVLSFGSVFTYIHAEDRSTGRPPNIEGGTPAADGWLRMRVAPAGGKRFWVEPYLHAARRQNRLSTLDLDDRRTGAGRSRSSIASFFNNGARARGLVGSGSDGLPNTPDDVLLATGETLAEVQDRVLGSGVGSSSLFTALPGYVVFGVRGELRFGSRHEVLVDLENLGDRNYRGISWGLDAPGRGAFVRYVVRF